MDSEQRYERLVNEFEIVTFMAHPVAMVTETDAMISVKVAPADLPTVKAMCIYAMCVVSGEFEGPYRDEDAERYAAALLKRRPRQQRVPRRRRRG